MHKRRGFTLMEVMVAVMIITVVIMSLIQINANNTHLFKQIKQDLHTNQYLSFLVANRSYGFEKKDATLYKLLEDFELSSELREELKAQKVELFYQKLSSFKSDEEESTLNLSVEFGRGVLKLPNSSTSLYRLRLQ